MKNYSLYAYGFEQRLVGSSTYSEELIQIALEQSASNGFTYRLETSEHGQTVGGFRFFQGGEEITQMLIESIFGGVEV